MMRVRTNEGVLERIAKESGYRREAGRRVPLAAARRSFGRLRMTAWGSVSTLLQAALAHGFSLGPGGHLQCKPL